jgi:hypothetical protein
LTRECSLVVKIFYRFRNILKVTPMILYGRTDIMDIHKQKRQVGCTCQVVPARARKACSVMKI